MVTRDRVFMENVSLDELMKENELTKYEGHWNAAILLPKNQLASESASSVFTIINFLEVYCGAKLHDLIVAPSPDDVWSVALEERVDDDYEI